MKYIIISVQGEELAFLFPDTVMHRDMLETVLTMRVSEGRSWSRPYREAECVAAGFVSVEGFCYGHSESIGVDSRGEVDSAIIKK
jgi:hypothetical protein